MERKASRKRRATRKKARCETKKPSRKGPPPTDPPPPDPPPKGVDRYTGAFGLREAERLLWRAGFGPRRGQAAQFAALGLDGAVAALTRVTGPATLVGPEPRTELQEPIDPSRLLLAVTGDGAMLVRLDGDDNQRGRPNENYARELMELYALGPDRGAYTERDVREAARGLTGYTSSYHPDRGYEDFRFDPTRHDEGQKDLFDVRDDYSPQEVVEACFAHPLHPSFFVLKLWSAFVAAPPPDDQRRALERPEYGRQAGQRLFEPPNIAGWREDRWLDTATWRARWQLAYLALKGHQLGADNGYPAVETPETAVAMALRYWDDPPLRSDTVAELVETAERLGLIVDTTTDGARNAQRQDVLRHLVITAPDCQVS